MKLIHTLSLWVFAASFAACSGESDIWSTPDANGSNAGASGEGSGGTTGTSGGTSGTGNGAERVLVLDPNGTNPVTLRALASAVSESDDGFRIAGTLSIDTALDPVILSEADVRLRYDAEAGDGLQHIEGTARLAFPQLGILAAASLDTGASSRVSYELGENLHELANENGPLVPERKYLSFTSPQPLEADFGNATLISPEAGDGDNPRVLALDPSDPALFLQGAFTGVLGESDAAHVALSLGKRFTLASDDDDDDGDDFAGHLSVTGELDLGALELPLSIDGNTLFDLDPDGADTTVLTDASSEVSFRASGDLLVELDSGGIELELPVVSAWLEGNALEGRAHATYRGSIAAKGRFWPSELMLENPKALRVEGEIGGEEGSDVLSLSGNVVVAGVDLSDEAEVELDSTALMLSGKLAASRAKTELSGSIERNFIQLHGEEDVRIAISGDQVTETTVTDADACGTEAVTDADLCGTTTVTDADACGADIVTDQDVCGTTTVTDPVVCGTIEVTSAASCGTRTVTDALLCGISSVPCDDDCDIFEECNNCMVANTCTVPNTCTVAATCEVTATCEVPRTCDVPATCDRPRTCVVTETESGADLGEFRGTARLQLDERGLSGTVTGSYCVTPGGCTPANDGRITNRDGVPRVCITLPDLGETCTRF